MSHDLEVERCSDEMITEYPERETGYVYYRIGRKISVCYRGGDRYLCLKCVKINGCVHATRIKRFRDEHLEELNFAKADPAIEVPVV